MIRRNDTIYIAVLVAQALGIALNFIEIIFSLNLNIGIGTQIDIILSRPCKKEKLKSELLC